MRVLDNLENYDIPSGFHLTAEQEEQLAADLKMHHTTAIIDRVYQSAAATQNKPKSGTSGRTHEIFCL